MDSRRFTERYKAHAFQGTSIILCPFTSSYSSASTVFKCFLKYLRVVFCFYLSVQRFELDFLTDEPQNLETKPCEEQLKKLGTFCLEKRWQDRHLQIFEELSCERQLAGQLSDLGNWCRARVWESNSLPCTPGNEPACVALDKLHLPRVPLEERNGEHIGKAYSTPKKNPQKGHPNWHGSTLWWRRQ